MRGPILASALILLIPIPWLRVQAESPPRHLALRGIGRQFDTYGPFHPIAFSPDSKLIAVSTSNQRSAIDSLFGGGTAKIESSAPLKNGIGIWDMETLRLVRWIDTKPPKFLRFNPANGHVCLVRDNRLVEWDIETGDLSERRLPSEKDSRKRQGAFEFLGLNKIILLDSKQCTVFDFETGESKIHTINPTSFPRSLSASRDGKRFVVGPNFCAVDQTKATELPILLTVFRPGSGEVFGAVNPQPSRIASWDPNGKTLVPAFTSKEFLARSKGGGIIDPQTNIHGLAFSTSGKVLASISDDHSVHLWNVTSKTRIATLEPTIELTEKISGSSQLRNLRCVQFSPDGKWLACASDDFVSLWNTTELRKRMRPGNRLHLTRYIVRGVLFEEEVKPQQAMDMQTAISKSVFHQGKLLSGTKVFAGTGNSGDRWHRGVVLHPARESVSGGQGYLIHFNGSGLHNEYIIHESRVRPVQFPEGFDTTIDDTMKKLREIADSRRMKVDGDSK